MVISRVAMSPGFLESESSPSPACLESTGGYSLCTLHSCLCGALVDARRNHGLSCRRSASRQARHVQVNDTIHRALVRAGVHPRGNRSVSCARATNVLTVVLWWVGSGGSAYLGMQQYLTPLPSLTWVTPALSQGRRPSAQQKSNMTNTKSSLEALSSAPSRSRHWASSTRTVRDFWQTWGTGCRLCRAIRGRLLSFQSVYLLFQRCNAVSFAGSFDNFWPVD